MKYFSVFLLITAFLTGCKTSSQKPDTKQVLQEVNQTKSEFCLISDDHIYELNDEMLFANIKPMKVESGAGDGFKWEIYTYPNVEIKVLISDDNKKFYNKITTTSSDYHTPRGIKVGDNFEKLSEAYKEEFDLYGSTEDSEGVEIYVYDPEHDVGFNKIFFYIENNVINKIILENGIDG